MALGQGDLVELEIRQPPQARDLMLYHVSKHFTAFTWSKRETFYLDPHEPPTVDSGLAAWLSMLELVCCPIDPECIL